MCVCVGAVHVPFPESLPKKRNPLPVPHSPTLFETLPSPTPFSLVNTMPPGYSLNWGGNGDYEGGASRLTLTDLRGVTFIQDCFDGEE